MTAKFYQADGSDPKYLSSTPIIDSDHEKIIEYADSVVSDAGDDLTAKAVNLYYAVRDDIWYDPYYPFYLPEHYRASNVLKSGRGFCISKASLLCALGRSCGIPSRVGFATVRNHLATRQLIEFLGSDLFVFHGFNEFYIEGKWVRATPAFNAELCKKHKVVPLDFNGREDSLFHAYNTEKQKFMEYVEYHEIYADIPVDAILTAWKKVYGRDRVEKWIKDIEASGGKPSRNFEKEDVL
ncbi:transglutaminase-like domain-containing protein [Desulfococcaceae bacterium HSG8]|nr:transglutaminase-like domain-containing protein [Desulfococcaceae bacterium HSG8]